VNFWEVIFGGGRWLFLWHGLEVGNWRTCRPDAHVEFTTIWQDENK